MELIRIYECFCDRTRLRILNLLAAGPLCVCHLQGVLAEPQVKISKHLAYLRTRGLVAARREGNWMVYRLPAKIPRELRVNLACLQDCAAEDPVFRRDQARLARFAPAVPEAGACACPRSGAAASTLTAGSMSPAMPRKESPASRLLHRSTDSKRGRRLAHRHNSQRTRA